MGAGLCVILASQRPPVGPVREGGGWGGEGREGKKKKKKDGGGGTWSVYGRGTRDKASR